MIRLRTQNKSLFNGNSFWIVLIGILAAFALYLYQIDAQSLWRDEALSIGRAQQSINLIFKNQNIVGDVVGPDLHPPLYFLLLHGWYKLAGESEFAWRYVSALAMILSLTTFYAAGNLIWGMGAGRWTFLLALLSPFFLWHAQEARMYALVVGESVLVLLATWKLVNQRPDWKRAAGFTLAAAALILTHYSGLFLVAFSVLAIGLAQMRRHFTLSLLLVPLAGGAIVLLLLLPYIRNLLASPGFVAFAQRPLQTLALEAINTFSLGSAIPMDNPGWRIWPFVLLGLIGAGSGVYAADARRRRTAWFIIGAFIIPLLLIYLAAWLQANYSNPRHLTILSAAWFLLMGQGVAVLNRRWPPLAVAALIAVSMAGGPALYQTITDPPVKKDDVRGLAAYVEERMQPGDLVIWHDAVMMEVYERYAPDVPFTAVPLYGQYDKTAVLQRLSDRAASFKRVWFVEQPAPFFFDDTLVRSWLDEHLARTDFQTFDASWASLHLRLYDWPERLTELPSDLFPADLSESGYRVWGTVADDTAVSGQGTWLSVIWSGGDTNASPPSACVRLRDSASVLWADGCTDLTMPHGQTLARGEMMASQLWLALPQGLAPVTYSMELLLNDSAQTIGELPINQSPQEMTARPLAAYQNGLRLVGLDWASDRFRAGLWAVGSLVWQADTPLPDDLLVTARLVDWLGRSIAEETSRLGPADYPGSQWQAGELVRSFMGVRLPFTSNGRYRLQISVNELGGTAVPQPGLMNRTWSTIGSVRVEPWPMVRDLPEGITTIKGVHWGETIRLLGYDMVRQGNDLIVNLYWATDRETAVDYNVFIHVGQPGAPPLAQSSSGPANWTRPVSSWRPDEIIEDIHTIPLPPELPVDVVVSVGMFDSDNPDARVVVTAVDQPVPNDIWSLGPLPAP